MEQGNRWECLEQLDKLLFCLTRHSGLNDALCQRLLGAAAFSHVTQRGLDAKEQECLLAEAGRKKLLVVTQGCQGTPLVQVSVTFLVTLAALLSNI